MQEKTTLATYFIPAVEADALSADSELVLAQLESILCMYHCNCLVIRMCVLTHSTHVHRDETQCHKVLGTPHFRDPHPQIYVDMGILIPKST